MIKEKPKRGRPKKDDALKKKASDYKTIHLNVSKTQAQSMISMGKGPKVFFDTIFDFWVENFSIYIDQLDRKQAFLKRLEEVKSEKK